MRQENNVGCIVGRFQVPKLTEGHLDLIQKVVTNHSKTIMFLGLSPVKCSKSNPLDFESRKQMILSKFPDIIVLYIKDIGSDVVWSDNLDKQIKDVTGPSQEVILYGSRDSFIEHYCGRFETVEIEQTIFVSGTDIRNRVANRVKASSKFREGVIWCTANQYPKCYPTVDMAIIKSSTNKILLAKRNTEEGYRFPGGFVNPGETFEQAVIREGAEETGLELTAPEYIKSFVVDDYRYRAEEDKITTALFMVEYVFGAPKPMDDVDELRWFDINRSILEYVVSEHKPLMEAFFNKEGI